MNLFNFGMKALWPIFAWIVLVASWWSAGFATDEKTSDSTLIDARLRMVDNQIAARGIKNKLVLAAMKAVERHLFVPAKYRVYAYEDRPLPIEHDQTISQPYIVGLMTELAGIDSTEKVLEIGTGSGYQAAVLSVLARQVFTIEIVKPLADSSGALLERLGYDNVTVRAGDGFVGWPEEAPFDAVIVTCAPEEIPPALIEQLGDGGRLVIPVGDIWQELVLLTKEGDKLKRKSIIPVRFVPMTGEAEK